jgi:phage gp36-like protein
VKKLNCTRWKGIVSHPGPTGAGANGAAPNHVTTTLYPATGNTADTTAVGVPSGVVSEGVLSNTFATIRRYWADALNTFRNGDWTLERSLKARFIWQQTATPVVTLTTQTLIGDADYTGFIATDRTMATAGASAGTLGVRYLDQAFPTLSASGANNRREAIWATTAGGDESGTYFHSGRLLFWVDDELDGFQYDWIADAGWSTTDHLDPTVNADGKYTNAQLDNLFAATRQPNTIILTIGLNPATGETYSDAGKAIYKANVEAIIDRYRARMIVAGVSDPLFLLINPWQIANDESDADNKAWADARGDVLYEIAQERDYCGTIDLHRILLEEDGEIADWKALYLHEEVDDSRVHQNGVGVLRFGDIVNDELEEAAAGTGWHYADQDDVVALIGESALRIISNVGDTDTTTDTARLQTAGEWADAWMDARFATLGYVTPLEDTDAGTDLLVAEANARLTVWKLNQARVIANNMGKTPAEIAKVIEENKKMADQFFRDLTMRRITITAERLYSRASKAEAYVPDSVTACGTWCQL